MVGVPSTQAAGMRKHEGCSCKKSARFTCGRKAGLYGVLYARAAPGEATGDDAHKRVHGPRPR